MGVETNRHPGRPGTRPLPKSTQRQVEVGAWHGDADGPWTVIVGATVASAQTPVAGLVGEYLRATATYTDAYGDDKTAMAVSGPCDPGGAGLARTPPLRSLMRMQPLAAFK